MRFWNYVKRAGESLQSLVLLVIRLYWGYQFAVTGFGKLAHVEKVTGYFQSLGIPFPYYNTLFVGSLELLGGILLFLGLCSRIISIPLLIILCTAYVTADADALMQLFLQLNPDPFFHATPFLFGYAVLLVFCFGPGKISVDYYITQIYTAHKMP